MSRPDDPGPVAGPHPLEELPALAAGELELAEVRGVTRHLRACDSCRRALVDVVGGAAALRTLASSEVSESQEFTAVSTSVPPVLVVTPRPSALDVPVPVPVAGYRRRPILVAAAAVVVLLLVVTAIGLVRSGGSSPSAVSVTFEPFGTSSAQGTVTMAPAGVNQTMTVDTTLAAPDPGTFYEVWLLERSTGEMVSVGVLPAGGRGTYSLPQAIVDAHDVVDVSRQPDDGMTAHSADSVLRAVYRA